MIWWNFGLYSVTNLRYNKGCKGKVAPAPAIKASRRSGGVTPLILNPLNAKLNPICRLLALLGAHPIFYVSRIGVNPSARPVFLNLCETAAR